MSHKLLTTLFLGLMLSALCHAIELGNESMADKADRFDFEEFHKEKGITLWEEKKENGAIPAPATTSISNTAVVAAPAASKNPAVTQKHFVKGDELKVREAYKLGNDPALHNIPSLYDAIEALHKQLNGYCPNGWARNSEWHKPEQNYFYIHYSAVCL